MSDIEFRDPLLLLLTLLAPLAYGLSRRRVSAVRYSSLTLPDAAPRSLRVRFAWLPSLLLAASVLAIAVAVAGPRTPDAETKISREGIAIMMVVDHSGSMRARDLVKEDYSVNRLSVVKDVFAQFVLGDTQDSNRLEAGMGRPDDTIGLIAFAGFADSLCPLTLDHGNLVSMVQDLEIVSSSDEDGTAIGDGLALAVERLRRSDTKSKIAILLTDGVQNAGIITPEQAAELAVANDVKVYCIGTGTKGRAPFPTINPFSGRQQLRMMEVELDEDSLKDIAERTGGRYFRATDLEALAGVYAEIDELERTKVTELRFLQYHELYQFALIIGLVLLVSAAISQSSFFRTLP